MGFFFLCDTLPYSLGVRKSAQRLARFELPGTSDTQLLYVTTWKHPLPRLPSQTLLFIKTSNTIIILEITASLKIGK